MSALASSASESTRHPVTGESLRQKMKCDACSCRVRCLLAFFSDVIAHVAACEGKGGEASASSAESCLQYSTVQHRVSRLQYGTDWASAIACEEASTLCCVVRQCTVKQRIAMMRVMRRRVWSEKKRPPHVCMYCFDSCRLCVCRGWFCGVRESVHATQRKIPKRFFGVAKPVLEEEVRARGRGVQRPVVGYSKLEVPNRPSFFFFPRQTKCLDRNSFFFQQIMCLDRDSLFSTEKGFRLKLSFSTEKVSR